jgi:hypothetical protein
VGMARLYIYLGESEKAVECLNIALDLGIPFLCTFLGNQDMIALHNDPGFRTILEKMSLTAYYDYDEQLNTSAQLN